MMEKHKVMSENQGQDKIPEKQLNGLEIGNLPEKEFGIMIVKMIQRNGKIFYTLGLEELILLKQSLY